MSNNDIQPYQPVSYPYVNAQTLRNYIGKEVTLIGRVVSLVSDSDVFDVLTHEGTVTIYHNSPVSFDENAFVMIRGQGEDLNGSPSLRSTFAQQLHTTTDLDMEVFNNFILLAEGKFRDLFYD
ncbi:predicted protein [Naegleria gruberi]|uniref:Predicted protein n=1 Tax=Naegleria gruberi TaxID=5762 RepID=D2V4N8_NAEGR|nr:uncharacterized protein NAEGRDRAFT_63856 [Naegleria gruberi]EFC47963.1 predicted protein [Naegleria gruberi]|eukprot:XP_002680707.1 predicted protein [Naegleria gruberi strain NEG-M]